MKLEEVFGDGRGGKEFIVVFLSGPLSLPIPPIPRISFCSSLSPLQLYLLPVNILAKLFVLRAPLS
jgi:hypothetical protein